MKIEFGCGETPTKENFKTCDIRNLPGIDFVCPAWEIDSLVESNSVDEIFSRHFFEHLSFYQGKVVLSKWYKILKPNGMLEIILPNMTFHVEQWIRRKNKKELRWAAAGFWGWQREGDLETWDIHKSGYDFETLKEVLQNENFKDIKNLTVKTEPQHLWVTCRK